MRRGGWLVGVLVLALLGCDGADETDAGPPVEEDAGDGFFDCDPRNVTCAEAMPMCMFGFAATLEEGCWGPCLQAAGCRPIMCDAMTAMDDCPAGWGCVLGMCRPPRPGTDAGPGGDTDAGAGDVDAGAGGVDAG